jgi:hypothetical protein
MESSVVDRRGETHVDAIWTYYTDGSAPMRGATIFWMGSATNPPGTAAPGFSS